MSTLLDALAGAALLLGGVSALRRRPRDRCGALLALAGVLWLAGSLVPGIAPLLTAHRGPLVHAALAYPDGRLRGRAAQVAVTLAWVTGLLPALAGAPAVTIGLAVLVAAAGAVAAVRARGPQRHARRVGAAVAAVVTAVPAAGALLELAGVSTGSTVIDLYSVAVLGAAATLTVGLGRPRVERLVIELGASPGGRDAAPQPRRRARRPRPDRGLPAAGWRLRGRRGTARRPRAGARWARRDHASPRGRACGRARPRSGRARRPRARDRRGGHRARRRRQRPAAGGRAYADRRAVGLAGAARRRGAGGAPAARGGARARRAGRARRGRRRTGGRRRRRGGTRGSRARSCRRAASRRGAAAGRARRRAARRARGRGARRCRSRPSSSWKRSSWRPTSRPRWGS